MDKNKAFIEGVVYALEELASVYGKGITETDIWAEYSEFIDSEYRAYVEVK